METSGSSPVWATATCRSLDQRVLRDEVTRENPAAAYEYLPTVTGTLAICLKLQSSRRSAKIRILGCDRV
jgi:hypothetical protein